MSNLPEVNTTFEIPPVYSLRHEAYFSQLNKYAPKERRAFIFDDIDKALSSFNSADELTKVYFAARSKLAESLWSYRRLTRNLMLERSGKKEPEPFCWNDTVANLSLVCNHIVIRHRDLYAVMDARATMPVQQSLFDCVG